MQKVIILICSFLWINVIICTTEDSESEKKDLESMTDFLYKKIKSVAEHEEQIANLNRTEINLLVWSAKELLVMLKGHQDKSYLQTVDPNFCPLPVAPKNGGLVCVLFSTTYYCKPMCDKGYDFAFLRLSRVYEECGSHTLNSWTTQYIGGKTLAECIDVPVAVSGVKTAYFHDQCQQIISSPVSEGAYIQNFMEELEKKQIIIDNYIETFVLCGD